MPQARSSSAKPGPARRALAGAPPRVLVTGSSSGIGAAVARRLLAEGWRVEGLDVQPPEIEHQRFVAYVVDLCDPAHADALVGELLARGPIHALVHAAGVMRAAPLGQLHHGDGGRLWQLHVEAATRLADTLLPAMVRQGHGRVVLLGSRVSGGLGGRSQYAASKAALSSLARSWAAEVVRDGVTVNVVSPAATDTPMLRASSRSTSAPRLPPIGRLIRADEVASLVVYLLSPDAQAITGQDFVICGGASLPQ